MTTIKLMLEVEQYSGCVTRPHKLLGEFETKKDAMAFKRELPRKVRDFAYLA